MRVRIVQRRRVSERGGVSTSERDGEHAHTSAAASTWRGRMTRSRSSCASRVLAAASERRNRR